MRCLRHHVKQRLVLPIARHLFQGDALYCPVCDQHTGRFLSYGEIRRDNAQCPHCESLERHRLTVLYLQQLQLPRYQLRVLHVAPEAGLKRWIVKHLHPHSLVEGHLHAPRPEHRLDLRALPFPDASLDLIVCHQVLEHIPEDTLALAEMHRVLSPRGLAILTMPVDFTRSTTFEDPAVQCPRERRRLFGQEDHCRVYGSDVTARIHSTGLQSRQVWPTDLPTSSNSLDQLGLNLNEPLFVCHKGASPYLTPPRLESPHPTRHHIPQGLGSSTVVHSRV